MVGIKGFEMPNSCKECELEDYNCEDGHACLADIDGGIYESLDDMYKDCPLTEVKKEKCLSKGFVCTSDNPCQKENETCLICPHMRKVRIIEESEEK